MQKSCFSYPVELVTDAFGEDETLAKILGGATEGSPRPKVLIVADLNVVQRVSGLGAKIGRYVQARALQLAGSPVVISGGEKAKVDSQASVQQIVNAALDAKLGRHDFVLAIGGGTILDLAGYAAAQVRGGIPLVRMPTTPAAMLDAAYADYAAVDTVNVKDALRVPSVPAAVVIDVAFAASVLDGVWRGGISEAVRLALAKDATLFKKLAALAGDYRSRSADALGEIVRLVLAVRAKKGSTSLAQWSALRLEAMSGYKLPHGYAVSIGILIEIAAAGAAGKLKAKDLETVKSLLSQCGALDGLSHSQHLLNQTESLLRGLDAWYLSRAEPEIEQLTGFGKSAWANPEVSVYAEVIRHLFD